MKMNFHTNSFRGSLVGFVISIWVVTLWLLSPLKTFWQKVDYLCLDPWIRQAASHDTNDVVLVTVDENSLDRIGPWPWNREIYAKMIKLLFRDGAKVVGLDLLLDRPGSGDNELSKIIKEFPVVLAAYTEEPLGRRVSHQGILVEDIQLPYLLFSNFASSIGHVALIYDNDGVIRRIPAFLSDKGKTYPAFGIAVAEMFANSREKRAVFTPSKLEIDGMKIPLDEDGCFYIGYQGGPGSFPLVSAGDLVEGKIPGDVFRDKAVLIGVTTAGLADLWTTPFVSEGGMSGVEIHANVVQSILNGQIPSQLNRFIHVLLIVLLGVIAGITSEALPLFGSFVLILLGGIIIFGTGEVLLAHTHKIVHASPIIASWALCLLGDITARAISYRKGLAEQKRYIKSLSDISQGSSLKGLCDVLRDLLQGEVVHGFFITEDRRLNMISSPENHALPTDISEVISGLKVLDPDKLKQRIHRWVESKGVKWLFIPIENQRGFQGCYIAKRQSGSPFSKEQIQRAKEFAAHTGLVLENRRLLGELKQTRDATIQVLLNTLGQKSPTLLDHCLEVAKIAKALARQMGLDSSTCERIHRAGLLHDIGLLGIPDRIIEKTQGLRPEERAWIESHPGLGAELLGFVPSLRDLVLPIRHHHERYDGQGYPDGLQGDEIPIEARVLSVAEAFVTILWNRYRHTESSDLESLKAEAISEIQRHSGTQFDPEVSRALINIDLQLAYGEDE